MGTYLFICLAKIYRRRTIFFSCYFIFFLLKFFLKVFGAEGLRISFLEFWDILLRGSSQRLLEDLEVGLMSKLPIL